MPEESSSTVKIFYPPYDRTQLVELLRERLHDLESMLPLKRLVLFGSWAKRRATAFSDIDLLVIYEDPPRKDAYKKVWQCLKLRGLEPHVYSEQEFEQRKSTLTRMAEEGIVLFP